MPGDNPQLVPVGTIIPFAGPNPTQFADQGGWLYCNGDSLDRTVFAELFAAIGTNYGAPDGNHFNVPALQGMFLRGCSRNAPTTDPDVASRVALRLGGNTGPNVGSSQYYGTAPPRTPFNTTIANSAIDSRNRDKGCQDRTANNDGWRDLLVPANNGGDKETRPINKYVYFLIKYRMLDSSQNYVPFPVGALVSFCATGSSTIANNYQRCDGTPLSTTTFQTLFNVIAFAHGQASDTQFVVPDLRGYFLRGVDGNSRVDPEAATRGFAYGAGQPGRQGNSGDAVGSTQAAATALPYKAPFQSKFYRLPTDDTSKSINGVIRNLFSMNWGSAVVALTGGSGGDAETRPINLPLDWYIRYA